MDEDGREDYGGKGEEGEMRGWERGEGREGRGACV